MFSLVTRIANRLRRDYYRTRFNAVASKVCQVQPLKQGTEAFTLLSMVQQRDVHAYLLAARSFTQYANPSRIVIVCDPSITADDQKTIRQQIPHVIFRHADEFTHADIPRGGTWERLYAITEYAVDSYVIQLDADTVTLAAIPEVLEAIRTHKGFVIGEQTGQKLVTHAEAEAYARPWQTLSFVNIQALSEVLLVEAGLKHGLYVRGCSGFTGFPVNPAMREEMVDFSAKMQAKTKERWKEWGTEQITSNYLVANAAGTQLLPYPKYSTPDQSEHLPAFQHFIGYMRFINSKYERAAVQAIKSIRAQENNAA